MKHKAIGLLVVVLIAGAAGAVWWFSGRSVNEDKTRILLYGNVDIREVDLTFNNSEHIDRLLVQEGDRVRKGQLLATLHRERMDAGAAAAAARVAAQEAAVARLEAGSRPQEIRQMRAAVSGAEARLKDAETTFERTRNLYREHAASKQTLDDAEAHLTMARADLKVAREALRLGLEGPRTEDIEEARALLKAGQAQYALAQEISKDTEMFAPADGVIRNRILEPGDMASPQKPVITLALTNPVWVRAYAPETALGKLIPGMPAAVSTDSYSEKTYDGWIGYISPTAEFTPKNVETPELRTRLVYQVRVYVCNPEDELRLGMPATVAIALDQPKPEPGHALPECARSGTD